MSEVVLLLVAIAVGAVVWLHALLLLRQLYWTYREEEKKRTSRAKQEA